MIELVVVRKNRTKWPRPSPISNTIPFDQRTRFLHAYAAAFQIAHVLKEYFILERKRRYTN